MSIKYFATLVVILTSLGTLISLVFSIRRESASNRLDTLQRMVSELNELRRYRTAHPDVERSLFPARENWSSGRIAEHLSIVQLANTLEWAYIARREGLLDYEVWQSWVLTWQTVIEPNSTRENLYNDMVWTFGRSGQMSIDLQSLNIEGTIIDPRLGWSERVRRFVKLPFQNHEVRSQ